MTITVESQPLSYPERPGPIVFYSVSDTDFSAFESLLETDHTVAEWEVAMEFTDCRIYQIYVSSDAKFMTPEIAALGLQVPSIRNTDRGWQFRLLAPNRERLGDYWQYCREEGVQFHFEKLYSTGPQAGPATGDGLESPARERDGPRPQTKAL
ncbi:hypothetical protein [Natronorubrum sp. DTA7]|uniref:hypothetical protein n=1 Tax=Natronorubrum sp. DTA7 TaxID=3447016 RepID=UPI003F84F6CF